MKICRRNSGCSL